MHEFESEIIMNDVLKHNGELVNVNGHNIHIYARNYSILSN